MSIYASGEMYLRGVQRLSAAADPVSRQALAKTLGVSESVVNRVTEMLQGGGLLTEDGAGHLALTRDGWAMLPKAEALRA